MSYRILYIENSPDHRVLIQQALEFQGYTFLSAQSGIEGLELVKTARPDLILLDINLPDIDGYEVARRLRKDKLPTAYALPIIAITANAVRGDAEKALQAGCNVYMSKPINIHELWARVEACLPTFG